MKWSMSGVAILVAAVCSVAVAAQSGETKVKGDTMSQMEMKDTTYTGCIEAGSSSDRFTLTHLSGDGLMGKEMKPAAMKNGSMAKDQMAKDTMAKDTMANEQMDHDVMTPTTLRLASSSIDLRKYLGHKVSVTGSLAHEKVDAMGKGTMSEATSTFTVKSLKMVAASCS